jgi:GntR family transcriptional repressor for pyruvate dehydrogenase complex
MANVNRYPSKEPNAGAEASPRRKILRIDRISVPKPQVVLADHLRQKILAGTIAEGQSLPSERELVEQTGLSRGAVREALRTLVVEGMVQTKHGRFGGSIVRLPGQESMATAISRFVQGRKLPLRTLQETRELLEPYLAGLAAQRRSEQDLHRLDGLHAELVQAVGRFRDFALTNVKWHNAVAAASGNELLATLLHAVSHGVEVATMVEEYNTPETQNQVVRVHARINDAIRAGDAALAERSMRQHIVAANVRPIASASAEIALDEQPRPAKPRKVTATRRVPA